jgi:hypothetical protein
MVHLILGAAKYDLEPLKPEHDVVDLSAPKDSGGLLTALYQYRRLLTAGMKGFEGHFSHGGYEPFYPYPADGHKPKSLQDLRVDTEVLLTEHGAVDTKWFFSLADQTLLGFEATISKEQDPCEVYLSDYKDVEGRKLAHRIEVRFGNERYGVLTVNKYQLAAAK